MTLNSYESTHQESLFCVFLTLDTYLLLLLLLLSRFSHGQRATSSTHILQDTRYRVSRKNTGLA